MLCVQFAGELGHGQGRLLVDDTTGQEHSRHGGAQYNYPRGAGPHPVPSVRQDGHTHTERDGQFADVMLLSSCSFFDKSLSTLSLI